MALLLKYGVNIMEIPKSKNYNYIPQGALGIIQLNILSGNRTSRGKGRGPSFLNIPGHDFVV